MKKTYFTHQVPAHKYCMVTPNPALFMEMRLGKTLVVIRSAIARGLKKVLVIAPATSLPDWYDECKGEGVRRVRYMNPRNVKERKLIRHTDFGLCSFEYIINHPELTKLGWDCVVVDESTKIKNPKAQVTKFLLHYFRDCTRYILSGFPAPEDNLEYICQMLFLHSEIMGVETYWDFRKKHCVPPMIGYDWSIHPRKLKQLKAFINSSAFVLTRKAAGINIEQVYEKRVVKQSPQQKKATKGLLKDFKYKEHSTKWCVVVVNWVSQIAGGMWKDTRYSNNKQRELFSLLEGELKNENVVIYFRFTHEIEAVSKELEKRGIQFKSITGQTEENERTEALRAFRYGQKPTFRIMLAQIKCVRFSVNFAAASTAIYYSNSHSLEERVQSEQRIVHVSKKDPLLYIDLITESSLDEEILDGLKTKRINAESFLEEALEKVKGRL